MCAEKPPCSITAKTPGLPPYCILVSGGTGDFPCSCACWLLRRVPRAGPCSLFPPCLASAGGCCAQGGMGQAGDAEVTAEQQPPPEESLFPGPRWKDVAEQHRAQRLAAPAAAGSTSLARSPTGGNPAALGTATALALHSASRTTARSPRSPHRQGLSPRVPPDAEAGRRDAACTRGP